MRLKEKLTPILTHTSVFRLETVGGYRFAQNVDRFSRPVLSTAQSPIRLTELLCTLAYRLWQVISKLFNYAIIVYIFYILYILYEKVDTNLDTILYGVDFCFLYQFSFLMRLKEKLPPKLSPIFKA